MKFTIRDVLFATALAALALGWWLDRARLTRPPAQPLPPVAERYELVLGGQKNDVLFLLNPRTGEVWQRAGDASYTQSHWRLHTSTFAENK